MVSVYRGTGRVSYLALFDVSDVLVGLATLAGTGRASSRETFEQIFCFYLVFFWFKKQNGDTDMVVVTLHFALPCPSCFKLCGLVYYMSQ